jgi:putative ABC transport system permease protein
MTLSRLLRIVRHRIRAIRHQAALDAEVSRELTFHRDALIAEYIEAGMGPREAQRAARVALGNMPLLEEQCRDQRRVGWLHDLRQDLTYAARLLRLNRGFTVVAAVSLALGIGANSAVLTVMRAALIDDLPFPDADRLVVIRTIPPESPGSVQNASLPDYVAWKDASRSFDAMGASLADQSDFGGEGAGVPPERIAGQAFAPDLFSTLGVHPLLGRVLVEADVQRMSTTRVMVISYRLWQRRFGGDAQILSKTVRVNGVTTSIVGVMPPAFRYPNERAEYWVALGLNPGQLQGSARFYLVTARVKSGVAIEQAQAELDAAAAQLAADAPERHRGWGVRIDRVRDVLFGWTKQPLLTLEAAAALVLLMACVNIAGLLFARGAVRQPEIALRSALGAGRWRIVRQLLAESVLLSLLGGAFAVLVAWGGVQWLATLTPPPYGLRVVPLTVDVRMFAMMALLSAVTGVLVGVAPALAIAPGNLTASIEQPTSRRGSLRRGSAQGMLLSGQIAVALILLIGTALLANSAVRLAVRDLNFDPEGVLSFEFRIPGTEFSKQRGSYQGYPYFEIDPSPSLTLERVYDRLRTVPGVENVAGVSLTPLNALLIPQLTFTIEGRPAPRSETERNTARAAYFLITQDFFTTLRTPIVRGRPIDARDTRTSSWAVVVNETLAHRFWPGENPIGKRLTLDIVPDERPREVVGVVRDVPLLRAQVDPEPVIYASYLQQPARYRGPWANTFGQMTFLLRTSGDPLRLAPAARRAVAEIAPERPIAAVFPLEALLDQQFRGRRNFVFVCGVFAAAATLLAAVGIYGVLAYAVALRARELAIRMALGATAHEAIALVGRSTLGVVAIGLAAGLAGSLALTRFIASQLWGVTPTDPATFAAVTILFLGVAALASLAPVRRAIGVDPAAVLRSE